MKPVTQQLIKNGSENTKSKFKTWSNAIGKTLVGLGILLFIVKNFMPEYVDEQGILHEHFYLIPIGFLFVFAGLLVLATTYVVSLIKSK